MAFGPVKVAFLKPGKLIKVAAKGSGIGLTLNESSQGSFSAVFTSGTRRYCTLFGGLVKRDQVDKFVAVKAPAPVACP